MIVEALAHAAIAKIATPMIEAALKKRLSVVVKFLSCCCRYSSPLQGRTMADQAEHAQAQTPD